MATLWKWFFGGPVTPERVPTDTVIPLFRFDDTMPNRSLAFEYTMQFEDVLDAEKIATALRKLLEKPGWRKLGARLRQNDKGKLEYHIPAQYTKQRPPIAFSKVQHDFALSDHPLSKIVPRPNGTLQAFDTATPLREHLDLRDNTRYLADWLYTDKPQLGLHIVNFTDATFVTLTWGHTLLDAMGRSVLLSAWVAMLEGREDDVPEFMGYDTNPLDALGAPVSPASGLEGAREAPVIEDFVMKDKLLQGLGKLHFIFNFIWEVIFHASESPRMICMPGSYFARLRQEAYSDLASAPPDLLTYNTNPPTPNGPHTPFLSDGDILLAWTLRLLTASNPTLHSYPRPLLAMNVLGLRSPTSTPSAGYPALMPREKAYIHNCVTASFTLFPRADDVLTRPLGHVAARIRKDLREQSTRAQLEAGQRLARETPQPLFGSGAMGITAFSNWSKARLFDVDFSAAVVGDADAGAGAGADAVAVGDVHPSVTSTAAAAAAAAAATGSSEKMSKRGKPIFIQTDSTTAKGFTIRGSGNCVGVDHDGNIWFGVMLRSQFAQNLDAQVEALRMAAQSQDDHGMEAREPRWEDRKGSVSFVPVG